MKNRVLLVEDEEITGQMLKQALEKNDIEVTLAADGPTALNGMEPGKYDLVVLDLKLPGMSGDQVLEELRKHDPFVEVVVYTNYEEPPVMKNLIRLGIEDYIHKGADADLWGTVQRIKDRLDPFSPEDREKLLEAVPPATFTPDSPEKSV